MRMKCNKYPEENGRKIKKIQKIDIRLRRYKFLIHKNEYNPSVKPKKPKGKKKGKKSHKHV